MMNTRSPEIPRTTMSAMRGVFRLVWRPAWRIAHGWYRRLRPYRRVISLTSLQPRGCRFVTTSHLEMLKLASYYGERSFLQLLLEEVKPEDVVYDIGASIGLFSIHAAMAGARVVAFEPIEVFRRRLLEHIALNRLEVSIKVVDWAVSDQDGSAIIDRSTTRLQSTDTTKRERADAADGTLQYAAAMLVTTRSIDSAILDNTLTAPDVMKIDIEGAEVLALRGMSKLLNSASSPRAIFVELHPGGLAALGSSVDECERILLHAGYRQMIATERADEVHAVYVKRH